MDQVTAFYNKVLDYEKNVNWSFKLLQHMMAFFFVSFMTVTMPMEEVTVVWQFIFSPMFFMGYAIYSRLAPLVYIKEEGKPKLLSEKLKYVPLSKKQFFERRWEVLWRYILKLSGLSFAINLMIAIAFLGRLSVFNLLPLGMGAYGLAVGLWLIKM